MKTEEMAMATECEVADELMEHCFDEIEKRFGEGEIETRQKIGTMYIISLNIIVWMTNAIVGGKDISGNKLLLDAFMKDLSETLNKQSDIKLECTCKILQEEMK